MRPLELRINGFRSYAHEVAFDFRDRRLVGIVGPTGSGKSSLLDAIAFALYGKTPTVERDRRSLINQLRETAHVELWFEVDDQVWRAVRALRRGGQGAHQLYRHASDDPASERLDTEDRDREMTARVEELLGLDFAAFRRSVLLAQNQFAQFLHAAPGPRDEVLKGVFGFDRIDRMHLVAKERRDAARRDLEELGRLRQEIDEDRNRLAEARRQLEQATAAVHSLEAAGRQIRAAEAQGEAARREEEESRKHLDELDALASEFPDRKATTARLDDAEAALDALRKSEATVGGARAAVEEAERAAAAVLERIGGRRAVSHARVLLEQVRAAEKTLDRERRRLDDVRRSLDQATADLGGASLAVETGEQEHAGSRQAVGAAEEVRERAERDLHEAHHLSMAMTLRADLTEGGSCPVCGQRVVTVPRLHPSKEVSIAEGVLREARSQEAEAREAVTRAGEVVAAARQQVDSFDRLASAARQSVQEAEADVAGAGEARDQLLKKLKSMVGPAEPEAQIADWERSTTEADRQIAEARTVERRATTELEKARSHFEERRDHLQRLATGIATIAGRIGSDLEPEAEAGPLRAALGQLWELWQAVRAGDEDAAKKAAKRREDAEAVRRELLAGLGLDPQADFMMAVQEAKERRARLTERVEALEQRVARFAELERDSTEVSARLDVYTRLAQDLLPSGFLKHLLEEERSDLADLGGERFERLSGGRYRFGSDGSFDVVDLAAAETVRKPASLSGGETFLASLALALALAEMVSRKGGRLDAFFLDEGFGSLDPEHLDLAMDGVERLVADSPDRLVVVVSHVPELRLRVEDLIELDKDPVTGETLVTSA
ncbi:MAG: AAA family ATPase [Acidimicrobiia bacterium]